MTFEKGEIKIVMNSGRHFQASGYHKSCFFRDIGGVVPNLDGLLKDDDDYKGTNDE